MEKKFDKFFTAMLAVVLLVTTMFVGCGENTPVNNTDTPAATNNTTFAPMGEITAERLETVRESDAILREEIAKAGLDRDIWQYFTVNTGVRSVGVMGDGRTYDYTIAIRAITSIDGMTADFARIPWDVLQKISVRIVNEVDHVNRIVYDITSKPPATVEWE